MIVVDSLMITLSRKCDALEVKLAEMRASVQKAFTTPSDIEAPTAPLQVRKAGITLSILTFCS